MTRPGCYVTLTDRTLVEVFDPYDAVVKAIEEVWRMDEPLVGFIEVREFNTNKRVQLRVAEITRVREGGF